MKEQLTEAGKVKIGKENWEKEQIDIASDPINLQDFQNQHGEPRCLRTHTVFFKEGITKDEVYARVEKQIKEKAFTTGWTFDDNTPPQIIQDPVNKEKWFIMTTLRPYGHNTITQMRGTNYKSIGVLSESAKKILK